MPPSDSVALHCVKTAETGDLPATRDKWPAQKYPGGVRAASLGSGYDARSCASGPAQNRPHSHHPQC